MLEIKSKIKAIIFDMDGTIINTEPIWKQVVIDVLTSQGVKITKKEISLFTNSCIANLFELSNHIKKEFKLADSVESLMEKQATLAEKYFENTNKIEFIHGFENFHKKLQENAMPSGIATNAGIKIIQKISPKVNFENLFGNNIFSAEHVNKSKPDPAIFLHAAEKLNAKPEECIIFEDSLVGFQAAKAAGIKCIAIKNKSNLQYLKDADYAIESYDKAIEAIKKIL